MAFTFQKMMSGSGVPQALELPQTNASITKGLVGVDTSGYVGAAGADATSASIIGVIDETQDNSGGSAGDVDINVIISPDVLWSAVCTGTPAQSQMHDVVTLDASSVVNEDDPVTDNTGVIKLIKLINTTDKTVLCRLLNVGDLA